MAIIKTALELALEKTKNFTVDKAKLEEENIKKQGKQEASKLLEDPDYNIRKTDFNKNQKKWFKQGMLEVLLSNIVLPKNDAALENINTIKSAFSKFVDNMKYMDTVFSQLHSFFTDYLKEKEHVKELIDKQYAPHLQRKEEELSEKLGREVHINPEQDPEYISIIKNNMSQIDAKYQSVLANAKKDLNETLYNEM